MIERIYTKFWNMKESVIDDLREFGNYLQFITPMVVIIYTAWVGDVLLARVFIKYYLLCTFIQILLKSLFNNPRPSEVNSPYNPPLDLEWSVNKGDSFPSGHTMSAMSGGIFWANISCFQPYLGWAGILLGVITAISRLAAKAHWMRDVTVSACIAIILWYIIDMHYFNGTGFNNLLFFK